MSKSGAGVPVDKFMRWKEASAHVRMGVRTLQRYASMGKFKVHRPSSRATLVDRDSLVAWVTGGDRGCV